MEKLYPDRCLECPLLIMGWDDYGTRNESPCVKCASVDFFQHSTKKIYIIDSTRTKIIPFPKK